MASIKFYLKSVDAKQETAIFANCGIGKGEGYSRFKYYISESIHPDLWSSTRCRAIESKKFPIHPEFNAKLDAIEATIKKVLLRFDQEGRTPTPSELKLELDTILKPDTVNSNANEKNVRKMDLFQFVDHLISTSNNKSSTLKSFQVVRNNLMEYQERNGKVLTFRNLDIDFYNQFVAFLKSEGLATNTIGTRIKVLKTFLSRASDMGLTVNQDYLKKSFKKLHEETFSVYLTLSEIERIHDLNDLPAYLDRVRDLFLIGCFTGLRFSDLSRLTSDNIADGCLTVKTIKTGQRVSVPLHPYVLKIFEKYGYKLPKMPSNQKFNEYIREVVKRAQINDMVSKEYTKGGLGIAEQREKYKFVSSHTARRSFATNAFLSGMPSISIMKITGHKTESAFMKYIKMTAEDNAIKMKSHKFFNPMSIAK